MSPIGTLGLQAGLLVEWLHLADIVNFDSALLNHKLRAQWKNELRSYRTLCLPPAVLVNDCSGWCAWMKDRSVVTNELHLNGQNRVDISVVHPSKPILVLNLNNCPEFEDVLDCFAPRPICRLQLAHCNPRWCQLSSWECIEQCKLIRVIGNFLCSGLAATPLSKCESFEWSQGDTYAWNSCCRLLEAFPNLSRLTIATLVTSYGLTSFEQGLGPIPAFNRVRTLQLVNMMDLAGKDLCDVLTDKSPLEVLFLTCCPRVRAWAKIQLIDRCHHLQSVRLDFVEPELMHHLTVQRANHLRDLHVVLRNFTKEEFNLAFTELAVHCSGLMTLHVRNETQRFNSSTIPAFWTMVETLPLLEELGVEDMFADKWWLRPVQFPVHLNLLIVTGMYEQICKEDKSAQLDQPAEASEQVVAAVARMRSNRNSFLTVVEPNVYYADVPTIERALLSDVLRKRHRTLRVQRLGISTWRDFDGGDIQHCAVGPVRFDSTQCDLVLTGTKWMVSFTADGHTPVGADRRMLCSEKYALAHIGRVRRPPMAAGGTDGMLRAELDAKRVECERLRDLLQHAENFIADRYAYIE
jgi:hypothetical protein